MSTYTTGELAKECDVSVRTVQYYDQKDLLKPTSLSENGRRLYSEEDLKKLRQVCLLKSLGLSLSTIKGVLSSEDPGKILSVLLNEQIKKPSVPSPKKRKSSAPSKRCGTILPHPLPFRLH